MNRTQAHIALLKVSLIFAGLLAGLVGVSVLNTRPTAGPSIVAGVVNNMVARVPAAIPRLLKDKSAAKIVRPEFEVWNIPCLGQQGLATHQTQSRWIRLSTHDCESAFSASHLENKTNGFVATIFVPNSAMMTSDFIPLNVGANQLNLDVTMDSGEKIKLSWVVTRESVIRSTTASN